MAQVLVIDLGSGSSKAVARALTHAGYGVVAAVNGLAGLKLLRERATDLVIFDIGSADVGTSSLVQAFRAAEPTVPVLALCDAGQSEARDLVKALERSGVDCALPKPALADVLISVVENMIGRPDSDAEKDGGDWRPFLRPRARPGPGRGS